MPKWEENDLLYEADALATIIFVDVESKEWHEENIPPNYLYIQGGPFFEPLWRIADEFAQLNDYCVLCLEQTSIRLGNLKKQLERLESGQEKAIVEGVDYSGEVMMFLGEETIPSWETINTFIVRAMCLVLLSAFTEKSLKSLCLALAPAETPFRERKFCQRQEGKIECYLRFLKEVCDLRLDEPEEAKELRNQCRRIRNAFAHGDWDDLRDKIGQVRLREAFHVTSLLLQAIEDAIFAQPE